jgi:hypothetical protein
MIAKNCYHSTLGCKIHEDRSLKRSIMEGIINNATVNPACKKLFDLIAKGLFC